MSNPPASNEVAVLKTSYGEMTIAFWPNVAPKTVENFKKLAREGRAKEICRTCPVKAPCLDYAVKIKEPHGIWGGLNEAERKQLLGSRLG